MTDFIIQYHPKFFKDLERLTRSQLETIAKKIERIKAKPDGSRLWFLIVESRKSVYEEYLKRLYSLKMKLESF